MLVVDGRVVAGWLVDGRGGPVDGGVVDGRVVDVVVPVVVAVAEVGGARAPVVAAGGSAVVGVAR